MHVSTERARHLLDGVRTIDDLGRHFGGALYQREVEFLQREEWASTADDILERRTKHGLRLTLSPKLAAGLSLVWIWLDSPAWGMQFVQCCFENSLEVESIE